MSTVTATFHTARGPIEVALHADKTPLTVANFVNLVRRKYYDEIGRAHV